MWYSVDFLPQFEVARRIVQSPAQTPNKQAMRLGESASHPCPSLELLITSVLLRDSVRRKVLTSASLCSLGPLFQQNGRWTRGNRVEFVNIGQCSCSGSTVQRTLDLADLRPDLPHFFGLVGTFNFSSPPCATATRPRTATSTDCAISAWRDRAIFVGQRPLRSALRSK